MRVDEPWRYRHALGVNDRGVPRREIADVTIRSHGNEAAMLDREGLGSWLGIINRVDVAIHQDQVGRWTLCCLDGWCTSNDRSTGVFIEPPECGGSNSGFHELSSGGRHRFSPDGVCQIG
jgi:hypothetical protein